jgi:hypothetical protein
MSSKNNVNPDRYKVAGRDRPGEDLPAGQPRVERTRRTKGGTAGNFIPGAAPVGEPSEAEREESEREESERD